MESAVRPLAVQVDLATPDGVNQVLAAVDGRSLDVLMAKAGHGLGGAFLACRGCCLRRCWPSSTA